MIDNSANAGILAAQMLAIADLELRELLRAYKLGLRDKVIEKSRIVAAKAPPDVGIPE